MVNDQYILDLVAACKELQQDLQSNWRNKLVDMDNPKNWEILSQFNPIGSNYDWDFFQDIEFSNLRAVVSFDPDQLDDQAMYYIYDSMTWEAHSGGRTGKL